MYSSSETSFPGLAHITFHPDILINLGKYFFESYPTISEVYAKRQTRFNLNADVYQALGEIIIAGLRGETSYSLSPQVVMNINSQLHYFMSLRAYDDTCNNNFLNTSRISYQALQLEKDKTIPIRYDLVIYKYFLELFGSKRDQLPDILLNLIYKTDLFGYINNFSLEDSASLSNLVALLVLANHAKVSEPQPNVMTFAFPKGVLYLCVKSLLSLYKAELLPEDALNGFLLAFLKCLQPSMMVQGLEVVFNKIISAKIGSLSPELIKQWQQQYEQVFCQLITNSPVERSKLNDISKINDRVQAYSVIKTNAEIAVHMLDRFVVSQSNASPMEAAKCLRLLKTFRTFFENNNVVLEGFPQAVNSLCSFFVKKIDAKASELFASCLEFKKQNASQINILLNRFQAFQSKVFIDLADDKYFAWRDLVAELQLKKEYSSLIDDGLRHKCWLVLKTCALRVKLYAQYSSRLASIVTGFEQCFSEMSAWAVKIEDCSVVRDYFKYTLLSYEKILSDMYLIRSKCEMLKASIEDIIQDIGGFINEERPYALSQFFLQHNLNKSLLSNCKQDATIGISFAAEKIAPNTMSSK